MDPEPSPPPAANARPKSPIHHLNCGTMCPRGQRLLSGQGGWLAPHRIVCHVLLIESPDGLILVDTGFGTGDVERPAAMGRLFLGTTRPRLELAETAVSQVRALGFAPDDVKHIVLTHLDVDHAGGLPDFPRAQVHVWAREHEVSDDPPRRERLRYKIGAQHWAHHPRWVDHELAGDNWQGFESVRALPDSQTEFLLIPLPGHTLGHCGVAVPDGDGWLLHCGDAYFHRDQVAASPSCSAGLRMYQNLIQANGRLRRQNLERLRELANRPGDDIKVICSHDAYYLDSAPPSPAPPRSATQQG